MVGFQYNRVLQHVKCLFFVSSFEANTLGTAIFSAFVSEYLYARINYNLGYLLPSIILFECSLDLVHFSLFRCFYFDHKYCAWLKKKLMVEVMRCRACHADLDISANAKSEIDVKFVANTQKKQNPFLQFAKVSISASDRTKFMEYLYFHCRMASFCCFLLFISLLSLFCFMPLPGYYIEHI